MLVDNKINIEVCPDCADPILILDKLPRPYGIWVQELAVQYLLNYKKVSYGRLLLFGFTLVAVLKVSNSPQLLSGRGPMFQRVGMKGSICCWPSRRSIQ